MIFKNVSEHEITVSLFRANLDTIKDIVSKALTDNKISHEEFLLIKSEIDKYYEMRNSIRRKYQKHQPLQPQRQQPSEKTMNKSKGRFTQILSKNFSIKAKENPHKL